MPISGAILKELLYMCHSFLPLEVRADLYISLIYMYSILVCYDLSSFNRYMYSMYI